MIILTKPYGGPSNRLFQHIHLKAFCLANGIEFVNPFVDLPGDNMRWAMPPLTWPTRLRFDAERDYADDEMLMIERRLVLVSGWTYRNYALTSRHRDRFKGAFWSTVRELDKSPLYGDRTNIAVHVRRGDYARWLGGRYYFDDSVYLAALGQALGSITGPCRVLLLSDEELDVRAYQAQHGDVQRVRATPRGEQALMSLCDYIIGPPSTFSLWASYIGRVKHATITSADCVIDAASWSVCDG